LHTQKSDFNTRKNLGLYRGIEIEDIEKGTLRETGVSKRQEVKGKRRKLYKGEFHKSRKTKWADHVASVREIDVDRQY
jgi:hypothetical protein